MESRAVRFFRRGDGRVGPAISSRDGRASAVWRCQTAHGPSEGTCVQVDDDKMYKGIEMASTLLAARAVSAATSKAWTRAQGHRPAGQSPPGRRAVVAGHPVVGRHRGRHRHRSTPGQDGRREVLGEAKLPSLIAVAVCGGRWGTGVGSLGARGQRCVRLRPPRCVDRPATGPSPRCLPTAGRR